MQLDNVTLTIKDWHKYQPRKDLVKLSWFRVDTEIFDGETYHLLGNDGLVVFLFLLSLAAKKNNESAAFSLQFAATKIKIEAEKIMYFIKILEQKQLLHNVVQTCTDLLPTLHNNTIQTLHNNTEQNKIIKARSPKLTPEESLENKQIKDAYINAYRLRWGVEPVTKNAQFNTQVSNLRKKLGLEDSIKVVEFYLKHNDSFFVKNTHSFGLCLQKCETLRTQMLKGKGITQNDIKRFEKNLQTQQMIDDAKKGGF